ncbi:MAG: hypothetical protein JXQ29_05425, partial [Planctomycetes bacterium]|nr:hypothetical protein [Planctomycetota bacterium]
MFDVAKAAVAPLTGIAAVAVGLLFGGAGPSCGAQESVRLPAGVRAVWDLAKAHRETTATRERVCLNGLWRWQPAPSDAAAVPAANWGFFKVPGCWPGITDYLQKDFQTVHAHPRWQKTRLADVTSAWYEREITADAAWAGRRIVLVAEYVNSYAAVYLDGRPVGEIRFPGGEVDLTARCRPGRKHRLSLLVVALPLRGVMLSFNDTNSARQVKGRVARRGLCGDVHLVSMPAGARLAEVAVTTSVRKKEIRCQARLEGLVPDVSYRLHARVAEGERTLREFTGAAFTAGDLEEGRAALTHKWQPDELWDIHTPGHQYELSLSLLDARGKLLDAFHPTRFGFREFWIEGRDFFLNGTRLFLSAVPLD